MSFDIPTSEERILSVLAECAVCLSKVKSRTLLQQAALNDAISLLDEFKHPYKLFVNGDLCFFNQ